MICRGLTDDLAQRNAVPKEIGERQWSGECLARCGSEVGGVGVGPTDVCCPTEQSRGSDRSRERYGGDSRVERDATGCEQSVAEVISDC